VGIWTVVFKLSFRDIWMETMYLHSAGAPESVEPSAIP